MSRFLFILFLISPAFTQAGFSFVLKQRLDLQDTAVCDALIDESIDVILPNPELQEWLVYASVVCDERLPKELNIFAVFEGPENPLHAHFDSLAHTRVAGQLLLPKAYTSVFVDLYYLAYKRESSGLMSELSGFEQPMQVRSMKVAIAHKDELKQRLLPMTRDQLHQHLRTQLSPKNWLRWKAEVLPFMAQLRLQYHIYFLIGDGEPAVKAPIFGFTK